MPVEGGAHGAAAAAQDYEPFHEQWRELMRRASSLQATMQKFALELASAPPSSSSGGKMRRKMGGGSMRGRAVVEAEEVTRARAIGKALLSVSM